jgi:molybdopterin/thiamine biosynthesis adenylyltransferase
VIHRVGTLGIGETAVWIGVAAPHRKEAFRACEFIIDELKVRVPIWKREHYADGDSDWLGIADSSGEGRFARQMAIPEVGEEGQRKLANASILVVGAGGLGCGSLPYLAASGIGKITICDHDRVEESNLHRQVLYGPANCGHKKAPLAAALSRRLSPTTEVAGIDERLAGGNVDRLVQGQTLVIDGTDNFAAKFLINDACVLGGKPYSHGGILQFDGQTMTVRPGESPCYRCIFPAPPPKDAIPTCSQAGVIGVLPGVIGTIQATEAIKFLLGQGELLTGRLLTYSALRMRFREVPLRKSAKCPVCGENPTVTELVDELDALNVCDLEK